jgi:hypothetical protein
LCVAVQPIHTTKTPSYIRISNKLVSNTKER